MKIAIVHYHLRGGGVTRVISHTGQALTAAGHEVMVIAGEEPAGDDITLPPSRVVSELGYTQPGETTKSSPRPVLEKLLAASREVLGAPPDVWHIHNHSLGKNTVTPRLVHYMARQGYHLLLQLHDFAEDGRPENYRILLQNLADGNPDALGTTLYPQGDHVHYATLNCRDHGFLAAAGTAWGQLHLLPNAVDLPVADLRNQGRSRDGERRQKNDKRLIVYPTRAIRRKNLGEFLLWAALGDDDTRWAVTLAPRNPVARPVYEKWVALAEDLGLPVDFEYGPSSGLPFSELLRRADAAFTTSLAEGFGLAFLEPWLVGTPVLGRDLPEITGEFNENGVALTHLYERLDVPVDWVSYEKLRARIDRAARTSIHAYGQTMPHDFVDRVMASAVKAGKVDFGRLDEELQEQVINRVANSEVAGSELVPAGLPTPARVQQSCFNNRDCVLDHYSLESFGDRLLRIYKEVAESRHRPQPPLNADELLGEFLAPERFSLLRAPQLLRA